MAKRWGAGPQGKSFHPEEEGRLYNRSAPPMVRPTLGGTSAGVLRGPGRYGAGRRGSERPLSLIHFGCPVSASEILRGALQGYSVAAASWQPLGYRLLKRPDHRVEISDGKLLERFLLGTPLRLTSVSLLSGGRRKGRLLALPRCLCLEVSL